jgi:hypothetical protein
MHAKNELRQKLKKLLKLEKHKHEKSQKIMKQLFKQKELQQAKTIATMNGKPRTPHSTNPKGMPLSARNFCDSTFGVLPMIVPIPPIVAP